MNFTGTSSSTRIPKCIVQKSKFAFLNLFRLLAGVLKIKYEVRNMKIYIGLRVSPLALPLITTNISSVSGKSTIPG